MTIAPAPTPPPAPTPVAAAPDGCDQCGTSHDDPNVWIARATHYVIVGDVALGFCPHHANRNRDALAASGNRLREVADA